MRGDETKLYKISEASEILGVKQGILRKWDESGFIKTIRTPGNTRLFDISSINPNEIEEIKQKKIPTQSCTPESLLQNKAMILKDKNNSLKPIYLTNILDHGF